MDAAGRPPARYGSDLLGNRVTTATMDGGQRWMLLDVRSSQIRAWDSRGHVFTTTHDGVRRVLSRSVRGTDAVRSVGFEVSSGEIVGIAGVSGNGQRELAEAIAEAVERYFDGLQQTAKAEFRSR